MTVSKTDEPHITINGKVLTEVQAMTMRVAAGRFAADLQHEGLGDDDHSRTMTALYLKKLNEIFRMME